MADLKDSLTARIRSHVNTLKSEVITNLKTVVNKENLKQNQALLNLIQEVQDLVREVRFDPDNPKPIELRTEENSTEILKLNKKVIPMIQEASDALKRSNVLLERVYEVLNKVSTKIGLDDEF